MPGIVENSNYLNVATSYQLELNTFSNGRGIMSKVQENGQKSGLMPSTPG